MESLQMEGLTTEIEGIALDYNGLSAPISEHDENSPIQNEAQYSRLIEGLCSTASSLPSWARSAVIAGVLVSILGSVNVSNAAASAGEGANGSISGSVPAIQEFAAISNPYLFEEIIEVETELEVVSPETISFDNVTDYFLVPDESERGYGLVLPSEMSELSRADELAIENAKGVIPMQVVGRNFNAIPKGTMTLMGANHISANIYDNYAISASHIAVQSYEKNGDDPALPASVTVRLQTDGDVRTYPASYQFPEGYNQPGGLDMDPTDSMKIRFLTDQPIAFNNENIDFVYQSEVSVNPDILYGKDIYAVGFPRALSPEGELARVIVKGQVDHFDIDEETGLVKNIYLKHDDKLNSAIPSFGGISGGKVSFFIGEKEYVIGTYRGYKDDTKNGGYISVVTLLQDEYVQSGLKNNVFPDSGTLVASVADELITSGRGFDEVVTFIRKVSDLDPIRITRVTETALELTFINTEGSEDQYILDLADPTLVLKPISAG